MSWASERKPTRTEDRAYSLLGLFGVHIPFTERVKGRFTNCKKKSYRNQKIRQYSVGRLIQNIPVVSPLGEVCWEIHPGNFTNQETTFKVDI
jgi:hypothetical protein